MAEWQEFETISTKVVKCRKKHQCLSSGLDIEIGEYAKVIVGIWHGMGRDAPERYYFKLKEKA